MTDRGQVNVLGCFHIREIFISLIICLSVCMYICTVTSTKDRKTKITNSEVSRFSKKKLKRKDFYPQNLK